MGLARSVRAPPPAGARSSRGEVACRRRCRAQTRRLNGDFLAGLALRMDKANSCGANHLAKSRQVEEGAEMDRAQMTAELAARKACQIGRAHAVTPVTNAHRVFRL